MNNRKRIQGTVVRDKNDKTIVVMVESYRKHPKYKKRVQTRSKYVAHDENNSAKVGDIVTIEESRPLSATKRFTLVSIDQKAIEKVKIEETEELKEVLHEEKKEETNEESKEEAK